MTAGLLQLVTVGEQDLILTFNPQFTFFKKVYHKYNHLQSDTQQLLVVNSFGKNSRGQRH